MTIRKEGLAWRWYQEWVKRGGDEPPTMNLCHLVRVLVIWGPLRTMFRFRQKHYETGGWLDLPVAVLLFGSVFILTMCGALVIESWNNPRGFGKVLLVITGIAAVIAVIVGLALAWKRAAHLRELLWLWRNYRAAKTSKVCPLVKVD